MVAHNLVAHNREAVEKIADTLVARREIFGDDLIDLLDSCGLRLPELDYEDEAMWLSSFFAAVGGRRRPQIADASEATEATQA